MECFFLIHVHLNTCWVREQYFVTQLGEEPGGIEDETIKVNTHLIKINPQSVNCHEQVSKYESSDLHVHLKVVLLATTVPQSTGPTLVNNTCDMYM